MSTEITGARAASFDLQVQTRLPHAPRVGAFANDLRSIRGVAMAKDANWQKQAWALLDKIDALAGKVYTEAQKQMVAKQIDGQRVEIMFGLYVKVGRTVRAVRVLLNDNLHNEAFGFSRVLVEATVALIELQKDKSHEVLPRFYYYCQNMRHKMLDDARDVKEVQNAMRVLAKDHRDKLGQNAVQYITQEAWEHIKAGRWIPDPKDPKKGIGLDKALENMGAGGIYPLVYRNGSSVLHATDYKDYVEVSDNPQTGKGVYKEKDPQWGNETFMNLLLFYPACIKCIADHFQTGLVPEVDALEAEVTKVMSGAPDVQQASP